MAEQALHVTQRELMDAVEREVSILTDQLAGFCDEVGRLGLRDLSILGDGLVTLCGSVSTLFQIVRTQIGQADVPCAPTARLRSDDAKRDPGLGHQQRLSAALRPGEGGHP